MARQARQRTAAQRKPKQEDDGLSTAEIVDEQEQDAQISALKAKNENDNKQAQNALDVGVVTCLFIAGMQVAQHSSNPNPIFCLLAIFQFLLLPFSLTPHWLHSALRPYLTKEGNHLLFLSLQLTIATCAVLLRSQQPGSNLESPALQINEIARWILPALVIGGVEMQKRSERQTQEKMALLEGLRYDVKGA
ncbi:hypothetical protein CI109_102767 [Kwoniella shandongensis]|uniref:Uncharacterized protein n=1 Tax=Kwoniella shandongensis TaxID=1734106 RepID=A0A5M6BV30_9TREE|nr:uncharacterized protein CI109_004911 [Kwoniella shandongensis]KAA5526708.1 hypothetical protein CI109_004911 [Kwoniella shandongensis]